MSVVHCVTIMDFIIGMLYYSLQNKATPSHTPNDKALGGINEKSTFVCMRNMAVLRYCQARSDK